MIITESETEDSMTIKQREFAKKFYEIMKTDKLVEVVGRGGVTIMICKTVAHINKERGLNKM